MSASYVNGLPELYGSSPKEISHLETRINETIGMVYASRTESPSRWWSESSLNEFRGAEWTKSDQVALSNLAEVWIRSLVEKDNLYKLPDLTAYLALHFPHVDDLSRPAVELLDPKPEEGGVKRAGFSDLHKSEVASGKTSPSSDNQNEDYVQFRVWYAHLTIVQRVSLVSFLGTAMLRLCNESASEVKDFLQHNAMDSFQTFSRTTKCTLVWIPLRSLEYLQAYFQPGTQLLVTVLGRFLHLRDQLRRESEYPSLLRSLEDLLFSPTEGKELHLVDTFQNAARELGITHEELLQEMTEDSKDTRNRIKMFIGKYDLTAGGTWQWARYFSREYFSDLQPIRNKKASNLLAALTGKTLSEDSWVTGLIAKYSTRRDRASSASYEGFWDGARRVDYV